MIIARITASHLPHRLVEECRAALLSAAHQGVSAFPDPHFT
jgi:hypothetical protein